MCQTEQRIFAFLLLFCALAGCAGSFESAEVVPPSTPVTLEAGEGLLIIQIDSDVPLAKVLLTSGTIANALPKGQHLWVIRLPAGRYGWHRVDLGDQSGIHSKFLMRNIDVIREDEFEFEILPGAINYPGELIVRTHAQFRSTSAVWIRNRNHSAIAIRRLIETHAALLDAYPIRYAGWSEDGFLEHYSQKRRTMTAAGELEKE